MITSKLLPLARIGMRNTPRSFSVSAIKNSSHPYMYREFPKAHKSHQLFADVCGAFMWWWIFWHAFTDYGHVIGEHDFPCAASWTDEELGIPSDDAEDPE